MNIVGNWVIAQNIQLNIVTSASVSLSVISYLTTVSVIVSSVGSGKMERTGRKERGVGRQKMEEVWREKRDIR